MTNFITVDFNPFPKGYEIEKLTFTNEPQREIWLSCIIGGDDANRSYNESVSLKLTGDLQLDAFKKAVHDLVLRHEALRSTVSPNGEILIIYKTIPFELAVVNLTDLPLSERYDKVNEAVKKDAHTVLDLKEGPLFETVLYKTGEQEYYFTILVHHIIGDGWSIGIMLEDLGKMYSAYAKGKLPALPPADQISDYAIAQEEYKLTKDYKETEDYWLDIFHDDVPVLDLPTDRSRPSPRTYKGNRIDQILPKEKAERLKALGAKTSSSLVTTLLAAFEIFLYKITQQQDIVVGLPSSGQAATGLDDVVGHCVNLLPLKTHLDPSLTFASYLKKRKNEVLDAYDHQRLTFGELIKKLYIPRDPSRITLAPVMFNIDMGMDSAVSFEGLSHQLISNPRAYENFEIFLNVTGSQEDMILEWSYKTDLFDTSTIHTFCNQFNNILDKILLDADSSSIADLAEIKQDALSICKGAEVAIPSDLTINGLLANVAKQYPDKIAVRYKGYSLTYQQLFEKVNQLAAFLIKEGVNHGDIVAFSLDRSMEMLVSMLAILKAGAVYLPLDPEYPSERIAFMLDDSGATILLTSEKYKNQYATKASKLVVEEFWTRLTQQALPVSHKDVAGNDLAYLLYTSGSTGNPKGVQLTHRNLANFLTSMKAVPGMNETDRLLAITSVSFDIAGLELYLPLISGAELIIASTEDTKDGRLLLDIVSNRDINIMQATPSTWQMIIDAGWQKHLPIKILSGGEALPLDLANKLLSLGNELWNMYGPTETTIWSTVKKLTAGEKQISIGKPINNTQVYIMDENGQPISSKQTGEIYIGGDGVAAGYLNRTELTADRFVDNPFDPTKQSKLYRTGDIGKLLANGELQCLGRVDHQVKIRGYRIELGEIETRVAELEGVKQCVVLAREDKPRDKRLVAYLTLDNKPGSIEHTTWKDRWETLYKIGAEDKLSSGRDHVDSALLEHLSNSGELTQQHAEWLKVSLDRIKELDAKRIYEIGCGAGQILFEIAPNTEFYLATDNSQKAIENIKERLKIESGQWNQVTANIASADDFSTLNNAPIDLVLINSVAQYFPNTEYLIRVITQAVSAIAKDGGCVFIGDMQGKSTLEMYHAMDYLPRASDLTLVNTFKDVVSNRVRIEEELVADPAFFYLLPKLIPNITGVDVQLRKGELLNETTKYHYDVWLYVNKRIEIVAPQLSINWSKINTIVAIEEVLALGDKDVIEVKNVPNARTVKDYMLQQLLKKSSGTEIIAKIKAEVDAAAEGFMPDLFWKLGDKMGYETHVRWSGNGIDGTFDVIFIKAVTGNFSLPAYPVINADADIHDFARTPLLSNEISIETTRINTWREKLNHTLPAYMIPSDFVVLDSFPLTPNAKIDRNALPKPQRKKESIKIIERPLTANEKLIASVWSEVLGIEEPGATDDFFQLGGHSLLAVKVMVALEKYTGKRLTVATIFEYPTVERLAKQLETDTPIENQANEWDVLVPIKTAGSKVPIFFVHGADLNVFLFKTISEYFDADQPVYGLQAIGINGETDIPNTIEKMTQRYVADMLKANPDGPYAVAGYSLGGFIAFEIARQLQQMGKDIAFLGIIDTFAGNYFEGDTTKKVKHELNKFAFLGRSIIKNPQESLKYQISVVKQKLRGLLQKDGDIPKDMFTSYEMEIYKKYSDALDVYKLTSTDIKLSLFAVKKRLYYVENLQTLGWHRFAQKGVNTYPVSGDHTTVLYPPNDKELAAAMQRVLDDELNSKRG